MNLLKLFLTFLFSIPLFSKADFISKIPAWSKNAIWYQIYPESFRNGNKDNDPTLNIKHWSITPWGRNFYKADKWKTKNLSFFKSIYLRRYGGDLQGIFNKLDYLQELGITALYLTPIFHSPSQHKYDSTSLHHIDPHFGPDPKGDLKLIANSNENENPKTWIWTKADLYFLELIKEVHKRGIKIIIDGVFNHSGREFFAFKDIIKKGKESKYINWYHVINWDSNLDDGFLYKGWYGHLTLPEFKEDANGFHPKYFQYIKDITKRWMAPFHNTKNGIDGWRIDSARDINKKTWQDWRKFVKKINRDAFIFAESWHINSEYIKGNYFDALTNYPLGRLFKNFVIDINNKITPSQFDKKVKKLLGSYPPQSTLSMINLVSSHDTARLRTQIINPDLTVNEYKMSVSNGLDLTKGSDFHKKIHKLIALLQMTFIGSPLLYNGDESGMTSANNPHCKKPMVWPDINFENETTPKSFFIKTNGQKITYEHDLFEYYKKLIGIRKSSKALSLGSFNSFYIDDKNGVYGYLRQYEDEKVYVFINSSVTNLKIKLLENGVYKNLFNQKLINVSSKYKSNLDGKSALILKKVK